MSNANKIARYITTIDSTPSYAVNIFVAKPMTVTATSFFCFYCLFVFMFFIHIHILYAAWCFQDRREGQQYLSRPLSLRHWLSACAVCTLRGPCHHDRCVPIRCNTCQSYSINTMVCCPCSS